MKKNILLTCLFIIGFSLSTIAQQAQVTAQNTSVVSTKAVFAWSEQSADVGEVKQGNPPTVYFEFTNNGSIPLTINRVKVGCGCTVANYPQEPVLPKESAKIKVTYNAARIGKFKKSVQVYSNADTGVQTLWISGEVK